MFIGTSNKTDNQKSPFNFKEKKIIMTKMFGIPSNKIVNIRNPYAPEEILNKYDEDTTGLIVVVGEKDEQRLGGKYFTPYKGKVTEPFLDRGYVYAAPAESNPISGTDVRYWLSAGSAADSGRAPRDCFSTAPARATRVRQNRSRRDDYRLLHIPDRCAA